ncbi:dual specificity tyrosine-phosphorylation-regulated kinase mbk-1-like protein, partial [Tanacetum coccineum]
VMEQIGFIATDVFISKDLHKGSIVRLTKYVITDDNRYEISNGSKLKKVLLKLTNFAINSYMYLQVMQIIYTNYGSSLLALTSAAVHKLWKWKQNAGNLSGKSADKLSSMIWEEKHEHDGARHNMNVDNAYHIGAFLDVPIGQELNFRGRILKNLLDMVSQLH